MKIANSGMLPLTSVRHPGLFSKIMLQLEAKGLGSTYGEKVAMEITLRNAGKLTLLTLPYTGSI